TTQLATTAFVAAANATNANLTGPITSSGNTTSVASQTGTGSKFVMDTSPTLVTPVLGVATATSVNGTTIPTSKTLVVTTDKLNVLASTTSAELAGVISDETGTGNVVLSVSPTFTGAPVAPTATAGTNTTQLATTAFVTTANATNANLTGMVTSVGNVASLGSFTSANLSGAVTDETGTGTVVFANSPTFTGTPLAPTPTAGDNSTKIATTAFVAAAASLVREVADEFTATASQTSFALTQTPSSNSKVKMYVNGIRISNTAYSVSGNTLTYNPDNNGGPLAVGDRIQMDFYY
ncbi:hypothetical protein, partial [Confluentibacter flavum]